MEISTLAIGIVIGGLTVWQAMTIQNLKADKQAQQKRIEKLEAAVSTPAPSARDVWEQAKYQADDRLRNVVALAMLAARDSLDMANQISPERTRQILRELGLNQKD